MPLDTFLDKCCRFIRRKHLSYHTEETYPQYHTPLCGVSWRQYHPADMGISEIRAHQS